MSIINNIGNAIKLVQLLEFEVVFPGEDKLPFEQYLSGGSKDVILNASAFFLGFKNQKSKFSDNGEFLRMFFRKENEQLANQIYDRIKTFEKKGVKVSIINTYSSLKLFESYFSRPEETEIQTQAKFEVNLFKAYLVLNSEFSKLQETAIISTKNLDEDLKIPMMLFCMQYPVFDKINYNIYQVLASQMIKAIYLFRFLESLKKTQSLLKAFLSNFNCLTWEDYLKSLLPLTTSIVKNENEAHTDIVVAQDEKYEQSCAFIEKLIVLEHDEFDQNDFLTIRAKPFYKIKYGVYRIIFNLFVAEKIFKGVYFLLRDVNKTLPASSRIKEIKSFYGDEFSEKILFYKVIESIYSNKYIRFSGKKLADMRIDAAPDYYIRKGKNILVFESKDFLIKANKKMSFDFNIYKDEFGRILDFEKLPNGKIKSKAVTQLTKSIRRILKKEFPADTNYHYKKVFIYPVLLTHDHQYDTPGFNELLDYWFQDALKKLQEEGLFVYRVKPLSIVNIDSIICNQVGLENDIPLHKMLNLYHENKKMMNPKREFKSKEEHNKYSTDYKQMKIDKLLPFSMFIDKYFNKHDLSKLPPLFEIVAPALFKEEYEARVRTKTKQ